MSPLSDRGPPRGAPPAFGRTALSRFESNSFGSATPTELPECGFRAWGPLSPLLSHDFLQAPAGLRSGPRGVLRAPVRAAAVPGRPRGRAPRRAGEARRPPGGGGRAGRPGEEVAGRGGGGGEPQRQGGGDSAWKGGSTRICMKHRLGAGGSGSAALGPGRPSERESERAGKEEGSGAARRGGRGICASKRSRRAKFGWGLDFPSWRRHPNSHPVRKPKLSSATPRLAAATSAPRSGPARPGAVIARPPSPPPFSTLWELRRLQRRGPARSTGKFAES